MRKIFSSKTRWFVALLLVATLVFGISSCSSDSDDDDDDSTSSSSSNSSAPSANDLAGKKLSDINAASLSALEEAGKELYDGEPEGAWIVSFNSSGTGGYGYDYEGKTADTMTWKKYAISYDASTGILTATDSTDSDDDTTIYLVKTSSGFAVFPVSEGDNAVTSLSEVFGTGHTLSDGKIYYSSVQVGTYSESGNVTTITYGSETGYLVKISGYYYYGSPLYTYSGDLPS